MRHPTKPLPVKELRRKGDGVTAKPITAPWWRGKKNTPPPIPCPTKYFSAGIAYTWNLSSPRHPREENTYFYRANMGDGRGDDRGDGRGDRHPSRHRTTIQPIPPAVDAPVVKQGFAPSRWRAVFTFRGRRPGFPADGNRTMSRSAVSGVAAFRGLCWSVDVLPAPGPPTGRR
jgi:hypothetical protein